MNGLDAELLTAAVFVGMLVGGLLAGNAADRFGRRSSLLVSLAVNCSFAVISAAAPSVRWLIAARVCAGLGKMTARVGRNNQHLIRGGEEENKERVLERLGSAVSVAHVRFHLRLLSTAIG